MVTHHTQLMGNFNQSKLVLIVIKATVLELIQWK